MGAKDAAKMMNCANPKNTGGMHGLLPAHVGMRTRILEALDIKNGLVRDAGGADRAHRRGPSRSRRRRESRESGGVEDLPEALAAGVLGAHGE
eukprot:468039-Pyramimonas_sp.AAC.1